MNTDIRLSVGFWQHPKTKKTVKRLGLEGVRSLQVLWLWAAQNRPDGNLSGMDEEAIELAADWQGEEGLFFSTCAGMWIDQTEAGYALHDWAEHNPWQAEAEARSEAAKKAAAARWGNADAIKAHKGKHAPAMREQCGGNADAIKAQCPSSFPDPKPKPEEKSKIQKTPCQVFAEDSEAYRLAAYMQETLKANVPTLKEPDLQKWAKDFDVALRNDERMSEPRFVAQVIRWACSDSFWRANIQSPGKLREKFDQLTAKMEAEATKARASPGNRMGMSAHGNTAGGQERDYGQSVIPDLPRARAGGTA